MTPRPSESLKLIPGVMDAQPGGTGWNARKAIKLTFGKFSTDHGEQECTFAFSACFRLI